MCAIGWYDARQLIGQWKYHHIIIDRARWWIYKYTQRLEKRSCFYQVYEKCLPLSLPKVAARTKQRPPQCAFQLQANIRRSEISWEEDRNGTGRTGYL